MSTDEKIEEKPIILQENIDSTSVSLVTTIDPEKKNPGFFKKGNQFGKIKNRSKGSVDLIRKKTKDGKTLIEALVNIINNKDMITGQPRVRFPYRDDLRYKCIEYLSNRLWGTPIQSIELDAEVKGLITVADMLQLYKQARMNKNETEPSDD